MSTTTVGKGQSKGMLRGRQAAAKVRANADAVAAINAERSGLSRTACVTYLQTHGVYSGHSRDSIEQLRTVVADHQASPGGTIATAIDRVATGKAGPRPEAVVTAPAGAKPTARLVPDDHPQLRYVDANLVGTPAPDGLVHSVDSTGLVRAHKPKCKPNLPALTVWPDRVYAAACCKPRTPGATARTVYVPPSKRTA